jgi:lipopolysaccharide assembly protein A
MKIVRTIVWVLLLVALVIFAVNNWSPVEVKIWEGLVLETKIPALVVVAFLIGLVPMWLLHRAARWNAERRIASLESAARAAAMTPSAPPAAGPPADELTPTP